MPTAEILKSELLQLLDCAEPDAPLSEADFARLDALVDAISAQSPYAEPIRTPQRVEGRWETLFAHFGVRHSAGKPRVHMSNLKLQSFNRFPPLPVRVMRLCQEVAVEGAAYNNVIGIESPDASAAGNVIVRGRYSEAPGDNPKRFDVEFYRVEIDPGPGVTAAGMRQALGLAPHAHLWHELKPPRVYSDVVYLDDEIRINRGNLGGLYVLRRLYEPAVSLTTAGPR